MMLRLHAFLKRQFLLHSCLFTSLFIFHKDDKDRPEDGMAQRRAALLEKQQKRAEEMKRRKLEQEKEKELK